MKSIGKALAVMTAVCMGFGATQAGAVTIANPVNNYSFGSLGTLVGGLQTQFIGQTFTPPVAGDLTNFQFTLTSSSLQALYASVYVWDVAGIKPVGPALYTSANVARPSGLLNFNPTGITLSAGQTYVAFLSTYGLPSNTGSADVATCLALSGCNSNTIAGLGTLVYGNVYPNPATGVFDQITYSNAFNVVYDATFSATITPAAAVPEPATWAMLILGMGTVGAALRRRKTVAARPGAVA